MSKALKDPWLAFETEAIVKGNKNKLQHEMIDNEDINRMEQQRQGENSTGPIDFD